MTLSPSPSLPCPWWSREVQEMQELGGAVVVTGRLTIPTTYGTAALLGGGI